MLKDLRRLTIGTMLAATLAAPASAQQPVPDSTGDLVGSIVAVVGDSIITGYDLQQALATWRANNGNRPLPSDPAQLDALVAEQLELQVSELLMLQDAARDTTLVVPPEQIAQRTEQEVTQLRQRFGGELAFLRALAQNGITLEQFRQERSALIAKDMLLDAYLTKLAQTRKPPPLSEQELRAYFEASRAAFGTRPPTITFRQLVLPVQPSDSALERARQLADSVYLLARGGEDFATLARRFSEDTGTREQGGDLGWFERGRMMRAFEQAAFMLPPGTVGPPVRTAYGFHVIRVERARGSERQARHILIRPAITPADVERARELAAELADALRAGASMDSLIRVHADPDEQVHIGPLPSDSLPAPYDRFLGGAEEGRIVGPIPIDEEGQRLPQFAIVRVTDVNASGEYSLDDPLVRETLRRQLERDRLVAERVRELRRSTFVEIRSG